MTDKEILDLFAAVNDRMNSISKRLDDVFMSLHNASTSGISENDNAICDIADISDVNSTAIDDLAIMIDDLEQRVEALEEKE